MLSQHFDSSQMQIPQWLESKNRRREQSGSLIISRRQQNSSLFKLIQSFFFSDKGRCGTMSLERYTMGGKYRFINLLQNNLHFCWHLWYLNIYLDYHHLDVYVGRPGFIWSTYKYIFIEGGFCAIQPFDFAVEGPLPPSSSASEKTKCRLPLARLKMVFQSTLVIL